MKTTHKFVLISALLLMVPTSTLPMPGARQLFNRFLPKVCTALGWGIAAGSMWHSAVQGIKCYFTDKPSNSTNPIDNFIRQEAESRNITKPICSYPHAYFASLNHFKQANIFIGADSFPTMIRLLASKDAANVTGPQYEWLHQIPVYLRSANHEKDVEKFYEATAVIHHELSHIHNRDSEKAMAACIGLPFVSHGIAKVGSRVCKGVFSPSPIMRNLLKLPGGLGKAALSAALLCFMRKHQEFRADDGIPNNKLFLQASVNRHKRYLEDMNKYVELGRKKEQEYREKGQYFNAARCTIGCRILGSPFAREFFVDKDHPDMTRRIKRFEQRLAKIEAQEKEQAITPKS